MFWLSDDCGDGVLLVGGRLLCFLRSFCRRTVLGIRFDRCLLSGGMFNALYFHKALLVCVFFFFFLIKHLLVC